MFGKFDILKLFEVDRKIVFKKMGLFELLGFCRWLYFMVWGGVFLWVSSF